MESDGANGNGFRLGRRAVAALGDAVGGSGLSSRIFGRAEDCTGDSNLCEKPVGSLVLPVALAIVIPIALALGVLFWLHRRGVQKQKREDLEDPHKSLDFGTLANMKGGKTKRKSAFFGGEKNPNGHSRLQLSMDMNLSSPYLLPPGLQSSRESLHSLARTLHQNEDPYRPVTQYTASETGSLRSMPKGREGSSTYTGSTDRDSSLNSRSLPPPRQNSLPKAQPSPQLPSPLHQQAGIEPEIGTLSPTGSMPVPPRPVRNSMYGQIEPAAPIIEEPLHFGTGKDDDFPTGLEIPPPAARKGAPMSPRMQEQNASWEDQALRPADSGFALGILDNAHVQQHTPPTGADSPQVQRKPAPPPVYVPEPVEFEDVGVEHHDSDAYEERGRPMNRRSSGFHPDAATGLAIPQQDNKRLSVGLRPLPPDEIMDTEDPEHRANRIRSFYKEYFDDSKPEPPPMPQRGPTGGQRKPNDYHEDYDGNYLGEAAYFDPDTNAFVMPYSQPVSRRAMTPPPTGSRFPGPRGPGPRMHGGSIGGSSLSGVRGPPRPGSSASNRPPPRPRAGSTMSGRMGPAARQKPLGPPPEALSTLPTPSKLRDDSFALMGSINFAPPETFQERARGRSQSPMGERRPFERKLPVASPLVSAFEELPMVPSPHLLKDDNTSFTGLDFAPPRKFQEADNMSDAGSIRSNRSGISAVQLGAIRSGAGRVSRLPGDTIFSQAQMQQKLKPSWNMRD